MRGKKRLKETAGKNLGVEANGPDEGAETGKRRKALVYDRDAVEDAGDAVKLARKDGKAALGCEKVCVLPEMAEINDDLIVEVEEKR